MAQQTVRKAVIAAAGFGTRFLPQTKAMPKEMLPLVDKPIIQYVVEELVEAGIEDIIIVSGYSKRSIEDHFDLPSADLVKNLEAGGESKKPFLDQVMAIADLANFVYVRQKGPYGNATPLLSAEHLIGDEPFVYAFADDFVKATPSRFRQLIDAYKQYDGATFACVRATTESDYKKYGFVGGDEVGNGIVRMNRIVEKPGSKDASPSDLASVSGYVLVPQLFDYLHKELETLQPGNEFKLQDAMQRMIDDGHKMFGCEIQNGKFYDTGNKLDYIKTVVDFALKHEDIKDEFREYLRGVVQ